MANFLALIQKGAAALVGEDQHSQGNHANLEGQTADYGRPTVEAHGEEEGRISMSTADLDRFALRIEKSAVERERQNAEDKFERMQQRHEARVDAIVERSAARFHGLLDKLITQTDRRGERKRWSGWGNSTYKGNSYWDYKKWKMILGAAAVVAAIIYFTRDRPVIIPDHIVTEHVVREVDSFGNVHYTKQWY